MNTTTKAPAVFDSFTIERTLKSPPARVFHAFANEEAKMKWFGGGAECTQLIREMDFRIGGHEREKGRWVESGVTSDFHCYYHDIVPNERIVFSYKMLLDDAPISVSINTVEFEPHGTGTKLKFTEQGVFINGFEDGGGREHGSNELMDNLVASVDG